jgi:hypothetical protein
MRAFEPVSSRWFGKARLGLLPSRAFWLTGPVRHFSVNVPRVSPRYWRISDSHQRQDIIPIPVRAR